MGENLAESREPFAMPLAKTVGVVAASASRHFTKARRANIGGVHRNLLSGGPLGVCRAARGISVAPIIAEAGEPKPALGAFALAVKGGA
jgi:hypothetical protein